MMRLIIVPMLLLLYGSCTAQNKETEAEILWDVYGVPHIFSDDIHDMYYAHGWAQMRNHADLILKLYGQARGKASEYWDEEFLKTDIQVSLFEIPEYAEKNYLKLEEPFKSYLDAFVRGINDYAAANPESISAKYRKVLPAKATDILSHVLRVVCLEFMAYDDLNAVGQMADNGSNAFAIAPARSASGKALLLTNPHLPWHDFFTWFESHLAGPGFNAYGITMVGMPTLSMAFNNDLGWAFTVNTLDGCDRYEIHLRDGGYVLDGKVNPFRTKEKVFQVIQTDGSFKQISKTFRYTLHGPVLGEKENKAIALRVAGFDSHRILEQYHKMAASKNLDEFEEALKILHNPMFNILYADRAGNILYVFNGKVPKRPSGDFAYWKGTVDGTRLDYIWDSFHSYEELPRVLNPESGFLQNCNEPPWTCTWPSNLKPEDYPSYISPQFMHLRAQRSMNLIRSLNQVTPESLADCKFNTVMEAAERFLDDLLAAADAYPDPSLTKAINVLKNWDRSTDTNSKGSVLFATWFDKISGDMFEIPWNKEKPFSTPDGLKNPKRAIELLAEAAAEVRNRYGSEDIEWGKVHRFRMNDKDFPANGGPGNYGIYRTIDYVNISKNTRQAVFGDTYIAVTEFGDTVRAKVVLGYGNATQPGNKHAGDQLEMASEKKLRPALLARDAIMENLELKEELKISR